MHAACDAENLEWDTHEDGEVRDNKVEGPRLDCQLAGHEGRLRRNVGGVVLQQHRYCVKSPCINGAGMHTTPMHGALTWLT